MKIRNFAKIAFVALSLFSLTGCVELFTFVCPLAGENAPHCVQWLAVKGESPDTCAKVDPGDKFKPGAGNPPKDKCYLMIAEKTGDTSSCEKIEGGLLSYTKDQCYQAAALKKEDADLCANAPDEIKCRSMVAEKNEDHDCGAGYLYRSATDNCFKLARGKNQLAPGDVSIMKVSNLDGNVVVLKADGSYFNVTENSDLGASDVRIMTVGDSVATITFPDGKTLKIPPRASMELEKGRETLEDANVGSTGIR